MKAKDFIIENDVMRVLHHINRYSPLVSRYTAFMNEDPEGKYIRYDDAHALIVDHPGSEHIEKLSPSYTRSGLNFYPNVVEDPRGKFVRLHDVIDLLSGMSR
jgi:hypothetical protein